VSQPSSATVPDRDSVEILEIIANQAAAAIENARLYQALREAYETKGEFLSLVAHELQVPMGTLWGYADLLDREIASVELGTLRGFVQVLKANVGRLDALVQDLVEVSRAEAGALHLEKAPLDLGEVVLDSIAAFRPQVERRGLSLAVNVPLGLATVVADRDRLGQVLDNLLSNACKYTPAPGEISVSLRLVSSTAELDGSGPAQGSLRCPCVLVTVRDSGIGMSRAEQKRVFTRFFRSDHPVVRQEAGTGLGLYLVRLLVESQGGQVWVESQSEQGSRFFLALPVAEAN
jgi:signal transduction histidine kinase